MDPTDFIKVLAVTFVTLFPVVNPIGDAPIFLSLTRRYSASSQEVLARKIAAYGFALLAVSFLFGSEILSFFGITLAVIQITGGLIVASTAGVYLGLQQGPPERRRLDTPVLCERRSCGSSRCSTEA